MPFGQTSWGHTSKDSHSSHTFTEYTDAVCQWQCVVPCCDSCLISKCSKCQWSLKEHEAGAKSPCFHALKGSPVSLKVTLIPKRPKEGGGGGEMLFPESSLLCLQVQVEEPLCSHIIWALSLLCFCSPRSQPELSFFFPWNFSYLQIDGFCLNV